MATSNIASLSRSIAGRVLSTGEPGYDDHRRAWNTAVDQRPAAIVVPDPDDVAADVSSTLVAAAEAGLRVAVQGTGHGATGLVDESVILISMSHLRDVDIESGRARVGAGARWSDVVGPAAGQGLAALAGSSADVGVVGYSLGGGIGWLARRYGLASNAVAGAQVVTADGAIQWVDAEHEPELFWALRGGAANFGIVTELLIDLCEVPTVQAGALVWPRDRAGDVLAAYAEWAIDLPEDITPTLVMTAPPSGANVMIGVCSTGSGDDLDAILAPLRELGGQLEDTVTAMSPADLGRVHRDPVQPTASVSDARLLEQLPAGTARGLARHAPGEGSPLAMVELRRLGGAIARGGEGHGALNRLDGDYLLFALGIEDVTGDRAAIETGIADVLESLASFETARTVLNFVDHPVTGQTEFDPQTYRRLQALRTQMDPSGVLLAAHPL
jgi:FAD/FMN-containing dehydrogenase